MASNYWVRFYVDGSAYPHFEYHGPWWVSGLTGDGEQYICAAVRARDEAHAEAIINASFDAGYGVQEFSFADVQGSSWSPFCDRFPRADWMQWPEVTGRNTKASVENVKAAYG